MKQWQCANCGHIVASEDRPVLHWDDGHYCTFIEVADMPTVFNKLNDALHKSGFTTDHPTNQQYENILVYSEGAIVAAISEMPRSNLVKVLKAVGEVDTFSPFDTKGILALVKRS